MRAPCNGIEINYRCAGEGRDVILIHGLGANHAFWHLGVLLPLAREHRVTVYDLRGHGYSDMPPSGYSSDHMVADLHYLMNHLDIPRADLMGHSYGGAVALHYAAVHPQRVASLTVADSRIRALQPTNYARDWPRAAESIRKLREIGLELPENEAASGIRLLEQLASPQWLQAHRDREDDRQLFIPFGGWNGGQRSAERWRELLRSTSARSELTSEGGLTKSRLAQIRHPLLAVYGEVSPLVESCRRLQELIPHCTTEIIAGAGHFFPFSRPEQFVNAVRRFLNDTTEEE